MPPSDLALRAEAACYAVWPALRETTIDGWLLRFAGGHTNRANSVNVVCAGRGALADRIVACEALYRAEGLPTGFRLSTATPEPGLEEALDAAGFGPPFHTSSVLHADLGRRSAGAVDGVNFIEGRADARWLAASARLAGLGQDAAALRGRMIGSITAPAVFASAEVDGIVAAQAYGAMTHELVCINAVATAPAYRGRGLAGRAVATVLAWAERQGATGACLQVLADNGPALALYRRLGFTEALSRYHYRTKPQR